MARGRAAKLKKGQQKSVSTMIQEYQALVKAHDHDFAKFFNDDDEDQHCSHKRLSPAKMQRVAQLFSKLFSTSFRLAVPSLFRGMIQNLQDHFLMERIIAYLESGYEPPLIKSLAKDQSTREGITAQIRMACEEELADVVLRLSTEDCFDLACDVGAQHGRKLKEKGPPCACSFSQCLGCMEKMVDTVCNTPSLPPPPVAPVERQKLIHSLVDMLENEDSPFCHFWRLGHVKDEKWTEQCCDAWQMMADTLWEAADSIDPLKLSHIKEAHEAISKLNGVDLWYAVVMRELQITPQIKGKSGIRALQLAVDSQFSDGKNGKEKRNDSCEKGNRQNDKECDAFGKRARKALARGIRDQGNASFTKGRYVEASEHYTKAIGYDEEEVVYPLNRAACYIKLKKYREAEEDCDTAIELDCNNHKAWFRRGASRAGQGDTEAAASDFKKVLYLHKGNEKLFDELRQSSVQILTQSLKGMKISEATITSQVQSMLPRWNEPISTSDEEEGHSSSWSANSTSDHSVPSVAEVFTQVTFAVAFSHVLKKHTGIDIKVPIACSS